MAVSTIHKLDKIVLPSSVEFSVIRNARASAGIESLLERPAGHPHPMFRATLQQRPVVEFTTTQLDVALANITVAGASLGSSALYYKLGAVVGSAARNASSHGKITVAASCGYWTSIRLPHNGAGEANVNMTAIYDGSNAPFVFGGSQTLSGNLAAGNFFGCGPVAINGSNVPGIKEITIDSGVRLIQEGASSEVWDTFVGVEVTEPRVTIRTVHAVNWATLGLDGVALNGSTGLVFYARKFAANADSAARVADGTAEHILFQGLLGTAFPVDTAGDGSAPISDTLVVELVAGSDSVLPLVATTASAIT